MKPDAFACKSECLGIATFFFLYQTFLEYWGNLGQKYILQTVEQLIQLFVTAKVSFSGLLYFSTFGSEGKFPTDYLPNVAICLFAYQ